MEERFSSFIRFVRSCPHPHGAISKKGDPAVLSGIAQSHAFV